jgi:hypothetical protein
MRKIRVNTKNSKVVNGRLFISLLKAQQIKSVILKKLINYSNSVLFPNMQDKLVEYTGPYIRITN